MRTLYLLAAFVLACMLIPGSEAKFYLAIDNFLDRPAPLIFVVQEDEVDTYWWTPWEVDGIGDRTPAAAYQNFEGALGGQRDLVIGYEGATPQGSVSIITIASRQGSIAFPLGYKGGAYFQYDGDDFNGVDPTNPANVFPGALLNRLPGMGAHVNTTAFPERNNDGISIDFTSGGKAYGIYIEVIADHEVFYFFDAIDADGTETHLAFEPPASESVAVKFFFPFANVGINVNQWEVGQAQGFDFTHVAAFQVRVWTFRSDDPDNPTGGTTSDAIDTSFAFVRTFGYVITGSVQQDCECNGVGESFIANVRLDLSTTAAPGTIIRSTLTDANGLFSFAGSFLTDGVSYRVCLNDLTAQRCTPANGCNTVTLNNFVDPVAMVFFLTSAATLSPPQDRTVNCGDCTTIACLGNAVRTNCQGSQTPVTTFTDSQSGTCPVTIRRTFTDSGLTVTQTITVVDNVSPVITTPAQPVNIQCVGGTPTIQTWINNHGNAVATDCTGVVWTNNWDGQNVAGCGSKTVTFTATDPCNNPGVTTTATYSVQDTTFPVLTTPAAPATAPCNANGSDLTALTTWLNNHAGAQATDNCGTVTWTNNYAQGTLTRGCQNSVSVIFSAADGCGNTITTTSTFTINDTSAPVITTPAANQNVECSSSNNQFNTWLNNHAGAVATDVCFGTNGLTWTNNFVGAAPAGCNGSSGPVTFSVTDNCAVGNTAVTTATFTTTDTLSPVITTPASPLSVDCGSGQQSNQLNTWLSTQGGAVATDACTIVTWTNNFNSQTVNCASTPVTFTASDQCATPHVARTTATFSIVDGQAPVFSPPPTSATVECGPNAQASFTAWLQSNAGSSVTDNCAGSQQITVTNDFTGTVPALGCLVTTTVRFQASDPCQNRSPLITATFTISDTTAPTLTAFATDKTVSCDSTQNSQYATWVQQRGGATATDCTAVTWSNNAPATPVFVTCSGSTTVTFVAKDACNLQSATTATFTIQDDAVPVLTTPAADRQEECTGNNGNTGVNNWLAQRGGAVATDTCSAVTWTNNFVGLVGGCTASATVTFTASDTCGRTVSTVATYTVSDTRGPSITTPAQNRSVPCNDQTQAEAIDWVNSNGGAIATDACAPQDITWTHSLYGDIISCDFATVTFTATDSCGLSSSTTATFTSVDNSPPSFNPPASDLSIECNGTGNLQSYDAWLASHGGAVAEDSCALSFTWTNNAPTTGPVGCGVQTVTFSVEDNCNNIARTTATFRVIDTTSPTIDPLPVDLIVACDGNGNTAQLNAWVANHGGALAFDVCTATPTWTVTPGSQIGNSCGLSRPYTFRAADSCGNAATATANFIITDFDEPILDTPTEDTSYQCDGNGNINDINRWLTSNGGGVAHDACQNSVVWTHDYPGSGPLPCSSILVTFTIDDGCGNSIVDQALLTIADDIPPVFTFFPDDVILPCDADVSVEALGSAIASDTCSGAVAVGLVEFAEDEPPIGDCPGDHIITRRWTAVDECANLVTQDQIITVEIVKSSGPCDPEDCDCDQCCPSPAASDCLPVPCNAAPCLTTPCQASSCTCPSTSTKMAETRGQIEVPEDLIQPLPQCKPVYIYVNDDDDSNSAEVAVNGAEPVNQRMIVTNEPLHESVLKNKSSASALSISFLLVILAVLSLF